MKFIIVCRAVLDGGASVRRAWASWRRNHQVRSSYASLRRLDEATVRDLGLDCSELMSVAAELRGAAAPSRQRTVRTA